ncbi:hypothetical protein OIDMADRAFT_52639 [Oidiodendron maius Zn]|uniref:Uncharacterized protein n=1 Tax=Oidiodendron maius (strain Zn) TaxID=913774 RepID=A0A0C3CUY7_OIDMZ|nr:hypothetical protein OIDMADRAFT_52639 [Oidiodendron maius Zn]
MKVQWQISKKEEIVRFRAQLAQQILVLNVLFCFANLNIQWDTQNKPYSKLAILEEKIGSNSPDHEHSISEPMEHVDRGFS